MSSYTPSENVGLPESYYGQSHLSFGRNDISYSDARPFVNRLQLLTLRGEHYEESSLIDRYNA